MAVSQSVARPVRTGVQLLSAAVIVEAVDAFAFDMTDRQYAAAVALLTMVIGFVQVLVEDRTGKALLREPSPPEQPVHVVEGGPGQPANDVGLFRRNEAGVWDGNGVLIALACVIVIVAGLIFIVRAL